MARLIDADKLREKDMNGDVVDIFDVLEAPTVEAIPIEWLKQWEEKHKNDPCYCMFISKEILADWEKENEKEL